MVVEADHDAVSHGAGCADLAEVLGEVGFVGVAVYGRLVAEGEGLA
ncbi:MAG TPA: hypothetical protein VIR57_18885 [Chloroflexota bacterium]